MREDKQNRSNRPANIGAVIAVVCLVVALVFVGRAVLNMGSHQIADESPPFPSAMIVEGAGYNPMNTAVVHFKNWDRPSFVRSQFDALESAKHDMLISVSLDVEKYQPKALVGCTTYHDSTYTYAAMLVFADVENVATIDSVAVYSQKFLNEYTGTRLFMFEVVIEGQGRPPKTIFVGGRERME